MADLIIREPNCDRLVVFTRYPQPGKAKTRLIPALGAAGAAALQRQMTEHTLRQVQKLLTLHSLSVEIWFAETDAPRIASPSPGITSPEIATPEIALPESDRHLMQNWLGSNWIYQAQVPGNLGTRMSHAFQTAFTDGMEYVVTIGTDCPGLDADRLRQAFQALQSYDLVLGPAADGGYYLIGLRRFVPELFTEIAWSTAAVLSQTIEIAEQMGLSIAYLDTLTDIDRPEDLPVWQTVLDTFSPDTFSLDTFSPETSFLEISIIIPVLNEANSIQAILQTIQAACSKHQKLDIIVVDGGSQDHTSELARASGATVITTQPGRAHQMNAGAKIATGKILLFLHADTRLPHGFDAYIQRALAQSETIAGAFQLHIDGKETGLRWVEWGVMARSHLLQLPYGDQALFLRAETFRQLQGFPELPIMEDFVLVRRLQSLGRIAIVPATVTTSARRWQKLGVLKTTIINQIVILAYFLGVPLERIARWYGATRIR